MSSDAQVFANAAAIQHQAQHAGLRWFMVMLMEMRSGISEGKKTLDCREVGYTDADNEVVIYLDHNDEFEKVISRSKLEAQ
mgnify:CR=1 FL=1